MKQKPFRSAREITEKLNKRGDYGYSSDPLQLRILGFIAEQLEKLNTPKRKRAPGAWQKFFGAQLHAGRTPAEAAQAWKSRNPGRARPRT